MIFVICVTLTVFLCVFLCPYTSQQNGKYEHMLRTINNIVCTLLFHFHLPPLFWVEALHMACHLLNILPFTTIKNTTPHFKLFQKHLTYSHLKFFGCLCYPYLNLTHKLSPHTTMCVILGYLSHYRVYRCYDLSFKMIIIYRHVVFDETIFPLDSLTPNDPPSYDFIDDLELSSPMDQNFHTSPPLTLVNVTSLPANSPFAVVLPMTTHISLNFFSDTHSIPTSLVTTDPLPTPTSSHPTLSRAKHNIHKLVSHLNLLTETDSSLSRSYLHDLHDPHWLSAMQEEYDAFMKHETWTLVPRPKGLILFDSFSYLRRNKMQTAL